MKINKVKGFTLENMSIAMIVLGVLVGTAYPYLYPLINKAKSVEAKLQLQHISNMQTQYSYLNSSYSSSFEAIDFQVPKKKKDGGRSNYNYEIIEASSTTFRARATAVDDFDKDGIFNVWEVTEDGNIVEVVKD